MELYVRATLAKFFRSAVPVEISSVFRGLEAAVDSGQRFDLDDIPVLRSPFGIAWYEYRNSAARVSFAAHWLSLSADDLPALKAAHEQRFGGPAAWEPDPRCVTYEIVMCYAADRLEHIGSYYLQTGEHGELVEWDCLIGSDAGPHGRPPTDEGYDFFYQVTFPILYAVGLLNCKNVDTVDVSPPERLRKARMRRGKHPGVRHKVLRVKPMTGRSGSGRGPAGESGLLPLHLARGHFKDYRDSGLFGKLHGVYWWHPQARGNAANGEIKKTYMVDGPEAADEGD